MKNCDVIDSLAPHAQQSGHYKPNTICNNALEKTHTVWHTWTTNQASQFMSQFNTIHAIAVIKLRKEWQCSMDFQETTWLRHQVQRELNGTTFGEHIDNLRVSFYNGNNDRATWTSFGEAPAGLGRPIMSKPRSDFDVIIHPEPSGMRSFSPNYFHQSFRDEMTKHSVTYLLISANPYLGRLVQHACTIEYKAHYFVKYAFGCFTAFVTGL